MPKFFCDYCDVYLTHDSMSVRKAHNSGRNHLRNVVDYYQQIGHEKAQSVIDSITSSYAAEGQAHANPMLPQNQPHAAHHHMSHHGAPGSGPLLCPLLLVVAVCLRSLPAAFRFLLLVDCLSRLLVVPAHRLSPSLGPPGR
ncbi:uncharacterized protein PG998_002540 [Apiospora kogelbergensis]|uniref:uncharacterized protein n=1 Tax=Apiospora kogelbergensis TaxID=1337665 RepID=UPI003132653C